MEELLANAEPADQLLYSIITRVLLAAGLVFALLLALYLRRNPPARGTLTERMASRSWSTPQVGIVLGSLLLLYFLASFVGLFFYEEQIPAVQLGVTLLIYSIIGVLITLVNRKRGGSWESGYGMGLRQLKKLWLSPIIYLACLPFMMLAAKASLLFLQHVFGLDTELQEVAQRITQETSPLQIAYTLMPIFVAPLYEEVMFRGLVFPYLVKRVGLIEGTLLVSVLFAVMHFHLPSFLPLFLLSAMLCLTYWRTGSLWVCIGVHAIFNAVSILVLYIVG